MVVMASWVYNYPQTHQVVYIKYVQHFTYQSYLNKVALKNNKMKNKSGILISFDPSQAFS